MTGDDDVTAAALADPAIAALGDQFRAAVLDPGPAALAAQLGAARAIVAAVLDLILPGIPPDLRPLVLKQAARQIEADGWVGPAGDP